MFSLQATFKADVTMEEWALIKALKPVSVPVLDAASR